VIGAEDRRLLTECVRDDGLHRRGGFDAFYMDVEKCHVPLLAGRNNGKLAGGAGAGAVLRGFGVRCQPATATINNGIASDRTDMTCFPYLRTNGFIRGPALGTECRPVSSF
jgi:hypothetical protein